MVDRQPDDMLKTTLMWIILKGGRAMCSVVPCPATAFSKVFVMSHTAS
jgi:hypothetical protein